MDESARVDVLAVDLGRGGLSARRVVSEGGEEVSRARSDAPRIRAGERIEVEDLVGVASPLLETGPPDACVFSVADLATTVDAPALLARAGTIVGSGKAVVVDGAVATLVGALGEVAPGVVLDMGVGVSVLATDVDQTWARLDGWGPILGDRGSAAWLGRAGLSAALLHRDGIPGGSRMLLDAGRRAFGDERGWSALITEHGPGLLADFAPVVGDLADRDRVAADICRLAGEHLADTLVAGRAAVPDAPVTATGGLLLVDAVKAAFASALGRRYVVLVPALGGSLDGATTLALHLAGGGRLPHRPGAVHVWGRSTLVA